jgi:hypothetical protein
LKIVGTVAEINGMTTIDNVSEIKTILQVVQFTANFYTSSLAEKHEGVLCYITGNLVKQKIHQEHGRPETIWLITHWWEVSR